MRRRALLALAALPGCSVLPDRPFIETRRHVLEPRRPTAVPPRPRAPSLLLRATRAGPGMDARGLRRLRADATLAVEPYDEWAAAPAEAVEAALREWLRASGLFAAIASPGSRLPTTLVLETELLSLESDARGLARAALAALLIDEAGAGEPRLLGQVVARGEAAQRGESTADAARAMNEALAAAFAQLEARLRPLLPAAR